MQPFRYPPALLHKKSVKPAASWRLVSFSVTEKKLHLPYLACSNSTSRNDAFGDLAIHCVHE